MKSYPVIIFAFNRPDPLKACIESLKRNKEALQTDLYVYVDGFRENKPSEKNKVQEVRNICSSISGFKSVTNIFSDSNQGLGPSIIKGVSEVINKYGAAIVIEDDLLVQSSFLKFMNTCLDMYKDNKEVWSICGYSNKIALPSNYKYDVYFGPRSSSWGWGTWADRWNSVDWSFTNWNEWKKLKASFNKWGGSDCFSMLEDCKNGINKSWAIRFCFNQFIKNKYSLFPVKSLVKNDGFDGSGTNCRSYSRFKYELMPEDYRNFQLPSSVIIDKLIIKSVRSYHSIRKRLWSRIMYVIKK